MLYGTDRWWSVPGRRFNTDSQIGFCVSVNNANLLYYCAGGGRGVDEGLSAGPGGPQSTRSHTRSGAAGAWDRRPSSPPACCLAPAPVSSLALRRGRLASRGWMCFCVYPQLLSAMVGMSTASATVPPLAPPPSGGGGVSCEEEAGYGNAVGVYIPLYASACSGPRAN